MTNFFYDYFVFFKMILWSTRFIY